MTDWMLHLFFALFGQTQKTGKCFCQCTTYKKRQREIATYGASIRFKYDLFSVHRRKSQLFVPFESPIRSRSVRGSENWYLG